MTPLGTRYTRLWAASTAANLGDGIMLVGAPLVAVGLTREPTLVAAVHLAGSLPWLLLALHAGALADRYDRRWLMVAAALLRTSALAGVAVAAWYGLLSLTVLYLAVLAFGVGEVLFDTTSQSMVPDLVGSEHLATANGRLVGTQVVMNNFLGAPLAGVLVGLATASVFAGPALLYLAAGLLLVRLPGRYRPATRPAASMRRDIAEGLAYLRRHRTLRSLAALGCLLNLGNTAYFSVFVLFVVGPESPMGLPAAAYGGLGAALAVGSVAGSVFARRVERALGPRRVILGAGGLASVTMLVPVFTIDLVAIGAMAVVLGAMSVSINVAVVTSRQRIVPRPLLGRVNSAFRLATVGVMPIGAVLGGTVAGALGLRALFVAAVAIQIAGLVTLHRPITDAGLTPVPHEPRPSNAGESGQRARSSIR
jgi:MFS family permease